MIEDTARALVHFEVEPNYAGWTLAEYVAEKLERPLAPASLDRLLAPARTEHPGRGRCGTKPGNLLRSEIPIRTVRRLPT